MEREAVNFGALPPLPEGYVVRWVESLERYMAEGPGEWEGSPTWDRHQARRQAMAHARQAAGGTPPAPPTTEARALEILATYGPLTPGQFARHMWPDSPSWRRPGRCGRGSTTGVGIRLRAGSLLFGMLRRGLVRLVSGVGQLHRFEIRT